MAAECTYNYKGKQYTKEQLLALPEFKIPFGANQLERDYINSSTGYNTYNLIYSPAATEPEEAGAFVKFIQFKRSQLFDNRRRLNDIERYKKKRGITTEELTRLNNLERELKLQIEGNFELGIKGLIQEISELERNATIDSIGYYVEKDLQRLNRLTSSNTIDDLNEAQRIVDFYILAGTFRRNIENPFFMPEEIFLEDEDGNLTSEVKLSEDIVNQFKQWSNRAMVYQNIIDKRKEEALVNTVNSNPQIKNTYGDKNFSYEELIHKDKGLKDTDWLSMWTMDVTQGIFSHNGIIPQTMFSVLNNLIEKRAKWRKDIEEKVDKLNPSVQKELMRLGYSLRGAGILGIKGASYQIFKEITKEGNETGGLIQRFIKEFYDAQSEALNLFSERFEQAKLYTDFNQKNRAFNRAFENLKRWRRENTIIMEINRLPELVGDNPDSKSYKDYLVSILGEKGYNEQLERQKMLLKKYESEKQSMIDTLMTLEGVTDPANLSDKAKSQLSYWESNHDPKRGIEDYYSVPGIFFGSRKANNFMDYNNFIPRRFKANISVDNPNNPSHYLFHDTTVPTEYYSADFETIEGNPILSEFYDVIKEVCETVRENMPYELQQKMTVNTIPALMKTSAEIVADKNTGTLSSLFLAFRNLMERIKLDFGIIKQSELSFAVTDPITGRTNYKVNDQFLQGNARAVRERMLIERTKFIHAYNNNGTYAIRNVNRYTTLPLSNFSEQALILLAEYINVDISLDDIRAGRIDAIRNITGENVQVGKYTRDFSMHSVVQSQSFDLAKIAKYYANMISMYAARQEALPILEIMKQHYETIKKPITNNIGRGIYNSNDEEYMKTGVRTMAMKQMDDYFERVVLDNYGTKHSGIHGESRRSAKKIAKIDARLKEIEDQLANNPPHEVRIKLLAERENLLVRRAIPGYSKTLYSREDKKKLGEIEALLKDENDPEKIEELIKVRENLGKARTATAFFDNLWTFIRTMRLGYNISSATTNFIEGTTSNMILAASGDYFDHKEIYYGYHVAKASFLKNISFGLIEFEAAAKNRALMDKFNVIMDSKNELQKSSVKSYSSKFSWLAPHELNQRVEYLNQSPIMIAMLRTMKIKDKNNNESSIWDAMNRNGHLKDEFRTPENIKNWEELSGDEYLSFKQKLHKAIVLGHGNYHELRGMMIKSSIAGKALMMFKTWIPMQFYWRFAVEQDDIQSGKKGYRGRYWSFGKGTGATYVGSVAGIAFGPLGFLAGGALGYFLGKYFGTDSGVGFTKELVESTKQLAKKALGMPVNILAGKKLIGTGSEAFNDWVGRGEFTEQDARNMRSNMADLTIQLAWLALILLVKGMLWDDDDEPDDSNRIAHNILVNRLMTLSSQSAIYVNPPDAYKSTIGSNAVIQYLTDVGKEINKVSEYLHGRDIIQSGINAGESGLWNQTKKTFMPGIFRDKFFGFESQAERVFEESPYHPYFKSEETVDREQNKRERAERRLELRDLDYDEKEIRQILDNELPTPSKLKKMGLTREEYEEQLGDNEE